MDRTATFYSGPSYLFRGAGLPVYAGSRRQRGGTMLGALKNVMLPFAAKQALGLANDVMMDAMRGRKVSNSLKTHGLRRLKNVGIAGLQTLLPGGHSVSRRRTSPRKKASKSSRPSRKRPLRKSHKQPPAKRPALF